MILQAAVPGPNEAPSLLNACPTTLIGVVQVFSFGPLLAVQSLAGGSIPPSLGRAVILVTLGSFAVSVASFVVIMTRTVWATLTWDSKMDPGKILVHGGIGPQGGRRRWDGPEPKVRRRSHALLAAARASMHLARQFPVRRHVPREPPGLGHPRRVLRAARRSTAPVSSLATSTDCQFIGTTDTGTSDVPGCCRCSSPGVAWEGPDRVQQHEISRCGLR